MKKKQGSVATSAKKAQKGERVVSRRKNTSASTRNEGRQRSGNNGPQKGSH